MESWNRDISPVEKKAVMKSFGKHLSKGQIKVMRAAHLIFWKRGAPEWDLFDAESGRRIIDCFTSAGCFNVGRGNGKSSPPLRRRPGIAIWEPAYSLPDARSNSRRSSPPVSGGYE